MPLPSKIGLENGVSFCFLVTDNPVASEGKHHSYSVWPLLLVEGNGKSRCLNSSSKGS